MISSLTLPDLVFALSESRFCIYRTERLGRGREGREDEMRGCSDEDLWLCGFERVGEELERYILI
jgi:hypothetical protein